MQTQLAAAEARLAELDAQGVEGDGRMRTEQALGDGTVLKLRIYRGLGFELEAIGEGGRDAVKKEEEGGGGGQDLGVGAGQGIMGYQRVIVRSGEVGIKAKGGDVHIVNLNPKFSRFFYAGYLWGCL